MTEPTHRTAAETLHAAAALLRERAAQATPGPWAALHTDSFGDPKDAVLGEDEEESGEFSLVAGTALSDEDEHSPGTYESHHMLAEHDDDDLPVEQARELFGSLQWAATVHPGLAEALAVLLEHQADASEVTARLRGGVSVETKNALAVARVILGETPADDHRMRR